MRKGNCADALRTGRVQGADPKGSCPENGNFTVIYFQIGEKNHAKIKKGDTETNKLCLKLDKSTNVVLKSIYNFIDKKLYRFMR